MKAVLFDLDGTLVYSLPDIAGSMNRALALHGLPPHGLEEYKYFVGNGAARLCARATGSEDEALNAAVLADYRVIYSANCTAESRAYEGVAQLLADLRAAGLRLAVLSNKDENDTVRVLHCYFPDQPFSVVHGRRTGVPLKPDPTAALEIAAQLGARPEQCWYLGDTAVDCDTAHAAGMRLIAVSWGFRPESELIQAGAQRIAATPQQALAFMQKG